MRILDVGCGAGDVTLQAARLVGPTGSVLGVDVDAEVLAVATRRAAESGIGNVAFRQAAISEVRLDEQVDMLIGRLILIHLSDPVAAVRAMSGLVRPGGILAFQDFNVSRARTVPAFPLVDRCIEWICDALRAGGRNPLAGEQLTTILRNAGFPTPRVAVTAPAFSDPDSSVYDYYVETVVSVLPFIEKAGIVTREEVDVDTLAARLRAGAREVGAVVYLPELIGAWATVPGGDGQNVAM
jgi:ubiquinone/menaquinone biosynthesis C-methylase UbiE